MLTGIFTTLRVEADQLWQHEWHHQRLLHDASLLRARHPALAAYVHASLDSVFVEARRALASQLDAAPLMVRLVFFTDGDAPSHRVEVAPARRPRWQPPAAPLALLLRPDPRPPSEPRVKWLDRHAFAETEAEAIALGAQGVLLHGEDKVREGTWFHLAAYIEGVWRSPPSGPEVIFGATRAAFLMTAKLHGERCDDAPISVGELHRADAVFALSSLLGCAPVRAVGEWHFPASEEFWRQRGWVRSL